MRLTAEEIADFLILRQYFYVMKKISLTLFLFLLLSGAYAQSYGTTVGVRLSNDAFKRSVGLSFEQRLAKRFTLEGILQSDFKYNTTFHALARLHQPLISRRLNAYAGAGFSMGSEQSEVTDEVNNTIITTYDNFTFGSDLLVGLEFTLLRYTLSLDYKPNFNLTGREPWFLGQTGVSLNYVMVTGAKQNRKWRQKRREKRKEDRKEEIEEKGLLDWIIKK